MKIKEIITEHAPGGNIRKNHEHAHQGVWKMRDVGGYDRVYHLNRIMMAAGMADGENTGIVAGIDSASWIEKYNTAYPYTDEEHNKLKAAIKTIPSDAMHVSKDSRSVETGVINKISPVAKIKKNKYGV
jgi:hypothetical protein